MELFIAGLEAEGWRIVYVYETSVNAYSPSGSYYRVFYDPKPPARLWTAWSQHG